MTFNAGTNGALAANGAISGVDALTVSRASGATFTNAVTATSVTTGAGNYGMALNGGATIANAAMFNNSGGVALGNDAADVSTFGGALTSNASTTSLAGTIRTAGQAVTLGTTTLTTDVGLDSTNNGANSAGGVIALGPIDGTGRSLTIRSGASALALNGSSGSMGRLGIFDVVNSGSIALGSLTAGATQLRTAGTITGGTVDVTSLGVAAKSVQFSNTGSLVNSQSGAAAAPQVVLLEPLAVGAGPYMINGVSFATAPLPPVVANTTQVVDQVAQLVRTPTLTTFTQPTAPSVTPAPQSGRSGASSLGSFEPAAGPQSGTSSQPSDGPDAGEKANSDDDDDAPPAARRGRASE